MLRLIINLGFGVNHLARVNLDHTSCQELRFEEIAIDKHHRLLNSHRLIGLSLNCNVRGVLEDVGFGLWM